MSGLVYEAPPQTILTWILSITSLSIIFGITLLYVILLPLAIYLSFMWSSIYLSLSILAILISPIVGSGYWHVFAESAILGSWRNYFYFKVYKEGPIPSNSLIASFPHGLFPVAFPMVSGIKDIVFPEFNGKQPATAIADNMFNAPVIAPMLRWLGCIPANRNSVASTLKNNVCVLMPDGIAGVYYADANVEKVYIENRKGFIRIALSEGSPLVPVYCFGHTQVFTVYPGEESYIAMLSR